MSDEAEEDKGSWFIDVLLSHIKESAEKHPQTWRVANLISSMASPLDQLFLEWRTCPLTSGGLLGKGTNLLPNGIFTSMFYSAQESEYEFKIISLLIMLWKTLSPENQFQASVNKYLLG